MPSPSASRTRRDLRREVGPLAGVRRRRARSRSGCARGYCGSSRAARSGPASAHELGAQQLHLPVRREPEAHQLRRRRAGRPAFQGSGSSRRSWNSIGSARRRVDRGVDAGHVGGRERGAAGVDLARLALGHAAHAERAHQPVGRQGVRAGELGQAAGGRAAEELELPQPVLRRGRSRARSRRRAACGRARAARRSGRAGSRRGASTPRSMQPARRSCGSGRLKSWYQRPAPASAASGPGAREDPRERRACRASPRFSQVVAAGRTGPSAPAADLEAPVHVAASAGRTGSDTCPS